MARRARHSRHSAAQNASSASPAYIKRKIPHFDILDEETLEKLDAQVDWLIKDVGIAFRDDPEALEFWRKQDVIIEEDIIRADPQWIRSLCAKAPREFTQISRNRDKSVRIGGASQVFAPIYGAPFVRDLEGGRRYGDFEAFENLVKLAYMHPNLHHTGLVICEPCDVPVSKRHLDMVRAHLTLSDKPFLGAITEMSRAQDSVEMAQIVFGKEFMGENCVIMGNVNTNSPMLIDKVVTQAVRVYCGAGQGIVVVPFILSGAMGPLSTAASVTQALAEAMMVCAYAQLIRPGAPFVLGNFLSSMSLKSGAPTFGMPEPVISNYAIGQMARRLGLPLRCGGSLTASKIEDAQAAYESADSMHSTMLAGANFVLHSAGWLEGGLCVGFEKLIMDADRLGSYQKILSQGLDVSEDAFARDGYEEVPPGGHFLGSAHTMRNYSTAFYDAQLSDNENVESWEEGGGKDMRTRAHARWNDMLAAYEAPPMAGDIKEALDDYVARRKSEIPDAWY